MTHECCNVASSDIAETGNSSALPRGARFCSTNFVEENVLASAFARRSRRARGDAARNGAYTQN